MQNKKIKQVNKNMQIPKARLWVIWLLMIVMPSIISIFGYNIFSKEYINFAKTDLIAKSYEGLKRYNQTIIPEKFLSNCLTEITSLPADKSPKQLKKDIDMLLCGETMLCLFFDKNSEKFITVQSENLNNTKNKIPPLALLRKALKKYNNIESNSDPIKQKQNEDALAIVLQQLFKTATMVPIKKDKISKNFSVFMGGELYFIYSSFTNPSKNIGGFLAVMQGRNFRFREMLKKVNNLYPYARIVFKDMNVIKTTKNPEIFHSGLKETNEGLFIVAPANESFIRHVIHGGTEQINHNYGNLLPFVEYRIPIDKIYEQVNRAYSLIRLFAFILILISSIYCLNVCFYGFSDNLSFKNKIIALALIASLFPFGLFFLGTYCYDKYKDFINKMSVIQHANAELQLNSQELEQYISEIEASMEKISEKLSQDLSNEKLLPSQLLESISEAGKELPLTSIKLCFNHLPPELEVIAQNNKISKIFKQNLSSKLSDEEDETLTNVVAAVMLENVNDTEEEIDKERERKNVIRIGNKEMDVQIIDESLQNNGKMQLLDQTTYPTWFILKMISNKDNNNVIAMLISKFEPRPILAHFLSKSSISRKKYKELKGNYEINYSFLPISRSGTAPVWTGSGNIETEDKKLCLDNPISELLENESGDKIIIKKKNQKIPHIAIATVIEKSKEKEQITALKTLAAIIAYILLILYLAGKLFDIMIIEPVASLASSARAIARGKEEWDAEIKTGDEFQELNDSFKKLVKGLKERNLLKSYVSEDAFTDIEESSNLDLLPGGEYIEATIVFSAIKDYDKIISDLSPQDTIKLLSKYISICETTTKAYYGSLDKILGNTVMLVFRDQPNLESHGLRAAKTALEIVKKIKELGLPGLYTGIASGTVISGKIGSYSGKLDFTVIGNPVNLAARFKSEAQKGTENTGIIISGITMGLMNGLGRVKFLRRVAIKGKARKYNIYELISVRD